jgi:Domain of unknown function (DUF4476)
MRYLLIGIGANLLSCVAFSQALPTITLVFVAADNNKYKNYEAVIDEVSYYSEQPVSAKSNDRNTIWLKNAQAGRHRIAIYKIKKGSHEERSSTTPVAMSSFTVRQGFDTKIAVKTNGQLQFSERASGANYNVSGKDAPSNGDIGLTKSTGNTAVDKNLNKPGSSNKKNHKDANSNNVDAAKDNRPQNEEDSYNNENIEPGDRHSRKRIDTGVIKISSNSAAVETKKVLPVRKRSTIGRSTNALDDQQINDEPLSAIDDKQFNEFYEMLRNQWLPGQRMKTLISEFSNTGDLFTTAQAKKMILLINEDGNRLKLAKSSYHSISDPENFKEMDDVLRHKTSRAQLDKFVQDGAD